MRTRLQDRLNRARNQAFTGREQEIQFFEAWLRAEAPPFFLLYLYGPGGQGKTTLLRRFGQICERNNITSLLLDGREMELHPSAVLEKLKTSLEAPADEAPYDALAKLSGRVVLFIDTYEKLKPLDEWFFSEFLPRMPDNVFTVISGRNGPPPRLLADPGWQSLMKTMQLRNFSPEESREFLAKRGIEGERIKAAVRFTHGHPLALSVVADLMEQRPEKEFRPEDSPDIIRPLMNLFVHQVPGPAHRSALEVCALVHFTTESLLAELLGAAGAPELFEWLQQLSFADEGRDGLYLHDLAREAIYSGLRWRHPDWHAELRDRARKYYVKKILQAGGEAQRKMLFGLLYLHRSNPVIQPYFDWQETGNFWMDGALEKDHSALIAMTQQHEGETGARVLQYWLGQSCARAWVWRDNNQAPLAFVLKIDFDQIPQGKGSLDPALERLAAYLRRHLRKGEHCALFRFWMAADTYQEVSPLQSSMFLGIVQYYFTPGLAISGLACAFPGFWKKVLGYAGLQHDPELDFETNGTSFGWFLHDWRQRPPLAWFSLMGQRELENQPFVVTAPSQEVQMLVLSESDFAAHAAAAFKELNSRDGLWDNPLARSRLVIKETGPEAQKEERARRLKAKIETALALLEESPADAKYHRVLYRTFVNPVGSQEATADFLNMSFSTYRRYLKAGIEKATAILWREELE